MKGDSLSPYLGLEGLKRTILPFPVTALKGIKGESAVIPGPPPTGMEVESAVFPTPTLIGTKGDSAPTPDQPVDTKNLKGDTVFLDVTVDKSWHVKPTPFECDTCGKFFTKKLGLQRHEMIHSGERPFTCSICSKSFSRLDNLRNHMRKQHKMTL
jgi:hypothetical protein